MPKSLLNDLVELETRTAEVEILVEGTYAQLQQSYTFWKERGIIHIDYRGFQQLNVQWLMTEMRVISGLKLYNLMSAPDYTKELNNVTAPLFEEEELLRKGFISERKYTEQQLMRTELTRALPKPPLMQLLKLHPTSISLYDQRVLAMLESYLWENMPADVLQVLTVLYDACERKQLFVESILGKEALIHMLMELYIPMYMAMPETLNMISMRVTPLTYQMMAGKQGTLYTQVVAQGQSLDNTPLCLAVQQRRLEAKYISSAKGKVKTFPVKFEGGATTSLDKEEKLYVAKGLTGKAFALIALMYATGIPYMVKRAIAQSWGLPHHYRLLRKPKISFLPLRLTLAKKRFYKYKGSDITTFNRDEYLKFIKKYGSRHG